MKNKTTSPSIGAIKWRAYRDRHFARNNGRMMNSETRAWLNSLKISTPRDYKPGERSLEIVRSLKLYNQLLRKQLEFWEKRGGKCHD